MSPEKIQVKNSIVELDGDEMKPEDVDKMPPTDEIMKEIEDDYEKLSMLEIEKQILKSRNSNKSNIGKNKSNNRNRKSIRYTSM